MKITMILTLILLLSGTGTLAAQEKRLAGKDRWVKIRAERMTERMAHEFGLSDKQKEELQKANEIWLLEYDDCPHYRCAPCRDRRECGRRWHSRRGGCYYNHSHCPTDGCSHKDFAEEEKKHEATRKKYEKTLKRILSKGQYKKYQDAKVY